MKQKKRRLPLERWVRARHVHAKITYDWSKKERAARGRTAHALMCQDCNGIAVGHTHIGYWRFREVEHEGGCEVGFAVEILKAAMPLEPPRGWTLESVTG